MPASPLAFVDFLQNHDQVGNRPLGDRLATLADEAALAAALAVTLLSPMPPLLFMGEEWGSRRPFPFFCDFQGSLAEAVRNGRRLEFKQAYAEFGEQIPDPLSEETFRSAILDWEARFTAKGAKRLALVRELLTIRHRDLAAEFAQARFGCARRHGSILHVSWPLAGKKHLLLLANLSDRVADCPAPFEWGRSLWGGNPGMQLSPWSVFWSIGGS